MVSNTTHTVAVLIATHNRVACLMQCLNSLFNQTLSQELDIHVFLVDDGSSDNTSDLVSTQFPQVTVIRGFGDWFWAKSMCVAEAKAIKGHPDYLLWLNDDVLLKGGALQSMLHIQQTMSASIVVGSLCDAVTGTSTYGGRRRSGWHGFALPVVPPTGAPDSVDAFHGNCVLVSADAARTIGPIDGGYTHAWADNDYSFRARNLGLTICMTPDYVGYCNQTDKPLTANSLVSRWRALQSPKGYSLQDQVRFYRRHGPRYWPLLVFLSHARRLIFGEFGYDTPVASQG